MELVFDHGPKSLPPKPHSKMLLNFLLFYACRALVTEIKVYENENVMLNCPADSLAVSWYRDGNEVIHYNPKNQLFVESDPEKYHYENGTLTVIAPKTGL